MNKSCHSAVSVKIRMHKSNVKMNNCRLNQVVNIIINIGESDNRLHKLRHFFSTEPRLLNTVAYYKNAIMPV